MPSLMSLGIKAMTANYAALSTTGHNIANANVEGYSRQQVMLATSEGQFTGAGFFGKGVDVVSVTRTHNEFLTKEASSARSLASMDQARFEQLQQLEAVFPMGEAGIGYATSELLNSMVELSNRPADGATREVVLARAGDLALRFQQAASQLDSIQIGLNSAMRAAVTEVNGLSKSIAEVNQRIAALRGLGQPANDLLDERERLISRLSEHVQVTRLEAADGTVSVFVGGGQRLVLGANAAELAVIADPADPSGSAIGIAEGGGIRILDRSMLGGGDLAGLLRFQNQDLMAGRALLGRLATAIGEAINEQQERGITLHSPLGSVSGSPLFAIGAPRALPEASNARAGGVPIGSVDLVIADRSALAASDYDLVADPSVPGNWLVTRLSDGLQRSIASGDTLDGVTITVNAAQPGDRFRLQPVSRAANGFDKLLTDARDLAAASPLVAQTAAGNVGTSAAQSLVITGTPVAGATSRITFTDDLGSYTWDLVDGGGATLASGSGTWTGGGTIPAPPDDINGFALRLSGVPRTGDVITVEPTPASAISSNNGNALALLAIGERPLLGGQNPTEAYAQAMAEVGVSVQGARSSADISGAVAMQTEKTRTNFAGVNLDEEAARLIQFQQSYQAAAKVLQVAQQLFDTLLDTAGA